MEEENIVDITGILRERQLEEGKEKHFEFADACIRDFYEFYLHTFKPYGVQDIKPDLDLLTPTALEQTRYHSIPEDALSTRVEDSSLEAHINLSDEVLARRKRFLASYVNAGIGSEETERIAVSWISADAAANVAKNTINLRAASDYGSREKAVGWFSEMGVILGRDESIADELPPEEQALLYSSRILGMRIHSSFTFHYLDQLFKKHEGISIKAADIVDGLRKKCTPEANPSFEELGYATPFALEDLKSIHRRSS